MKQVIDETGCWACCTHAGTLSDEAWRVYIGMVEHACMQHPSPPFVDLRQLPLLSVKKCQTAKNDAAPLFILCKRLGHTSGYVYPHLRENKGPPWHLLPIDYQCSQVTGGRKEEVERKREPCGHSIQIDRTGSVALVIGLVCSSFRSPVVVLLLLLAAALVRPWPLL
jgi:hypothetical protein